MPPAWFSVSIVPIAATGPVPESAAVPETGATVPVPSLRWSAGLLSRRDELAAEERPLALEIAYPRGSQSVRRLLAITMRTPGEDEDLAVGFLHAEGIVERADDVAGVAVIAETSRGEKLDTCLVQLARPPPEDLTRVSRSLITSSACGLCGRPGLAGLPLGHAPDGFAARWAPETIARLPEALRAAQTQFERTGGCHGAALADTRGALLVVREDVGRHNAADKVIGAGLRAGLPLAGAALVLSGRASFELVQKAAAAGIEVVAAVGAPSAFAVRLANECGIALAAFARDGRFNLYSHASRLMLSCSNH